MPDTPVQSPAARWLRRWQQGDAGNLDAFLASAGPLPAEQVVAVLLVEQCERWRRGQFIPAEIYLDQHPEVQANAEAAVELIYGEFLFRERRGEAPTSAEFAGRFPRYADWLDRQIALHRLLGSLDPASATTPPADLSQPMSGTGLPGLPEVPGYVVLEELGRGGMGVVYKARQLHPSRLVALKMLLAAGHAGAEQQARFLAEADAIARLQHPGIVQVFEISRHGDLPYLALEYVGGGSLAQQIAGQPQPPRTAAERVEALARAVQHAHEHGVIHRDLKPANVLLGADGAPRVTDFGLARLGEGGHTAAGAVMGTPSYMAPEQAGGDSGTVGPAADVYALGAILYEMLTGRPPFQAATALETLEQVRSIEPVPPRRLNPQVPADLETITLKCLHKAATRRYGSAGELADDLIHFQRGEPIVARPAGWVERALKWARRRPAAAALLGVSVLAMLGLAVLSSVAVWQWQAAVAALERARDAEETSRAHLIRAEENLKLARTAVDDCFNIAREHSLFQEPRMEKARKLLLGKTLPLYKNLRAAAPTDSGLHIEEAEQWFRVGYIEHVLMQTPEARKAYEKARGLHAALVEAHPEIPEYQSNLATTHNNLGSVLANQGKCQEALAEYRQARDLFNRLVQAHPRAARYRHGLATSHTNLGIQLAALGKQQQALAEYRQARDLQGKLVQAHPSIPDHANRLAKTHSTLGNLLATLGKRQEAVAEHQQARDLQSQLVQAHPDVPLDQYRLAATHVNLGALLYALDRHQDALTEYQQARHLQSKLTQAHPDVPAYQHGLATTHNNLAVLLAGLGKPQESLEEHRRARVLRSKLVQAHPEMSSYRVDLAATCCVMGLWFKDNGKARESLGHFAEALELLQSVAPGAANHPRTRQYQRTTHWGRAIALCQLGRHREAVADWDQAILLASGEARNYLRLRRADSRARAGDYLLAATEADDLARLPSLPGETLYNLACILALASSSASHDASRPLPERAKRSEEYARAALALLRRAAAFGYVPKSANDDLTCLHGRDDYKRFRAGLGSQPGDTGPKR
jgi:tetratricopeptide (TPR) repeat protein